MDFGGKRGSATASGWIDGVGYLAGLFAGEGIGGLAQHTGWSSAFGALAAITGGSAVAAVIYWFMQRRALLRKSLMGNA
jgi:OPA family glycerol-3-phosphate transporter-like MFS transporter